MRITVIGPTHPYAGGISHYNTSLCQHLSKKHEVDLISYKRRYPNFLHPSRKQLDDVSGIKFEAAAKFIIDTLNPVTWLKAFLEIKKFNPEFVIFHWVSPFMSFLFYTISFLTKNFSRAKTISICHNVLPHIKKTKFDGILTRLAFRNVDFFLIHSKDDLGELKKLKEKPNAKLTFHPTYDQFKILKIGKREAKRRLGIEGKAILFFGFVNECKGLDVLLNALPKILEKIDLTLMVVGEFWEDKEKYLKLIGPEIRRSVKIIDGYIPNEEVGTYFQAADAVVLPYKSASQSGVLQIAYGFDRPVVVTRVGGLPELVVNGETGVLVPPDDANKLADAIVQLFDEGVENFTRKIRIHKKRFTWDKVIQDIEDLIKVNRGIRNS